MKRETTIGTNGKTIVILTPENEAGRAELHRLAAEGKLDTDGSFGDNPTALRRLALLDQLAKRVRERRSRLADHHPRAARSRRPTSRESISSVFVPSLKTRR